jgi:Ca2+-binding EF-hand superfamily protein
MTIQGSPFSEEGRRSNFTLLDVQAKGELDLNDLRYISEQLKYGYNDDQLVEIIHSVGGYGAETISWDKFNKFIQRKVDRRRVGA